MTRVEAFHLLGQYDAAWESERADFICGKVADSSQDLPMPVRTSKCESQKFDTAADARKVRAEAEMIVYGKDHGDLYVYPYKHRCGKYHLRRRPYSTTNPNIVQDTVERRLAQREDDERTERMVARHQRIREKASAAMARPDFVRRK